MKFKNLYVLACCAFVSRLCFALRDGCGTAWRAVCCGRSSAQADGAATTLRLLEIFIGGYTLCWFAPLELESAAAAAQLGPDCVDKNESCAAWAAAGECQKNAAFMSGTCKAACKICKPKPQGGQAHDEL